MLFMSSKRIGLCYYSLEYKFTFKNGLGWYCECYSIDNTNRDGFGFSKNKFTAFRLASTYNYGIFGRSIM